MKIYFNKNGKVVKIKNERCGKPYCSTEGYRKNRSRLNLAEREALQDFEQEEEWKKKHKDS